MGPHVLILIVQLPPGLVFSAQCQNDTRGRGHTAAPEITWPSHRSLCVCGRVYPTPPCTPAHTPPFQLVHSPQGSRSTHYSPGHGLPLRPVTGAGPSCAAVPCPPPQATLLGVPVSTFFLGTGCLSQ